MKSTEIKNLFDKFEAIACEYDGVEFWSARELCGLLGYAKWQTIENVLAKAQEDTKKQLSGVLYERGVDDKGFAIEGVGK